MYFRNSSIKKYYYNKKTTEAFRNLFEDSIEKYNEFRNERFINKGLQLTHKIRKQIYHSLIQLNQ